MATQTKINDVLNYIETQAATITDLAGKIKVVFPKDPVPDFKDYGLRVYFAEKQWVKITRPKIGPITWEEYFINMDLVFNRALTPRQVFSDAKGISYWENLLISTFLNKQNNHAFKDSYWYPVPTEYNSNSIILSGILEVVVENSYGN